MHPLKMYRKHVGLTQAELGELLGITQPAVGHYESGRRKPPPEVVLQIERLTEGWVTRQQLRPDVYPPEYQRASG